MAAKSRSWQRCLIINAASIAMLCLGAFGGWAASGDDSPPHVDTDANESHASSPGMLPVETSAVNLFVCSTASCGPCKRMWRDVDDGKLDGFTLTKVPPFEGMKSYPAIRFADPDSDTGWSVVYGYDDNTRLWLRSKLLGAKSMSGYRLTFLPADEAPSPGLTIDGQCVRVIDGDTIVVETKTQYHVRLLDCWAPESRTKDAAEKQLGMASKNRLIELAEGKRVRVSIPLTGDFEDSTTMGRVLGRAWLEDGRELSPLMVAEGLATAKKVKKPQ